MISRNPGQEHRRLRRQIIEGGEAPLLLSDYDVCAVMDLTPRQLEVRTRTGALADMVMHDLHGRRFFHLADVRRLLLGSSVSSRKSDSQNQRFTDHPIGKNGVPVRKAPPAAKLCTPGRLKSLCASLLSGAAQRGK